MARALQRFIFAAGTRPIALAVGLIMGLAGCSSGPIIDDLPGQIGLPADAPARPAKPYQYPAVHDMPPPRATTTMSEAEQVRVEKELQAVRDRQERRTGSTKKASPKAKSKPAAVKNEPGTGAPR